jgi:hypothetical protein
MHGVFAPRLPRASATPLEIYAGDPSEPAATCHAGLRDSGVQMSLRQSESELPARMPEEDKSTDELVMSRPEEDTATELEQAVEQEVKQEVAAKQAVVTVSLVLILFLCALVHFLELHKTEILNNPVGPQICISGANKGRGRRLQGDGVA